jgi:hypothetical protein
MALGDGPTLLAVSIAALAPGVLGEAGFVLNTHASYAMHDARAPFRAMVLRSAVSLAVMGIALSLSDDRAVLIVLGLAVSLGNLVSAFQLGRVVRRKLPSGQESVAPALLRAFVGSLAMAGPAYLTALGVAHVLPGEAQNLMAVVIAVVVGVLAFLGAQRLMHSPELAFFAGGIKRLRPRGTT